ncbi:MAG TPA: cyclic nucleotide-binding domain-containing protein, partial [Acidimicrobiales bacterium]|nr:cyclic nucleotide-binding domain-containing protein [Acidimicrobiales bacterium]
MGITFGIAREPDEVQAVQRLRYEVYVEELGRYRALADHDARLLVEPEDRHSWLAYAADDGDVVAATRLTWGGAGFSDRQVDQYELHPWLTELPGDLLMVGERTTVRSSYRGAGVLDELVEWTSSVPDEHGVRVVFGCCEPHLLSLYIAMGQQPYAERNINSDEAGYLIPLVGFAHGTETLRGASRIRGPAELPACVERVLGGASGVLSSTQVPSDEYWVGIRRVLDGLRERRVGAFDGLSDEEALRCVERSNVIDCRAGDRLLAQGGTARNMFVVLSGDLEVRDDGRLVGALGGGDIFGEMAFLLEQQRTFDVVAVTDARVLSLSEGSLRRMIANDADVAAKLLLNVAKMLCARLIRAERM